MLKPLLLLCSFCIVLGCSRTADHPQDFNAPFLTTKTAWADSVLLQMTLDEKLGQVLLLQTDLQSSLGKDSIFQWMETGRVGGLLLENIPLDSFLWWQDSLIQTAKLPLFWATQQQVSLNNQFTDLLDFPTPATLSAIRKDIVRTEMEEHLVQQCSNLGINLFLGPGLKRAKPTDSLYYHHYFESDSTSWQRRSLDRLTRLQEQHILPIATNFTDFQEIESDTTGILDSILQDYQFLAKQGIAGFFVDSTIFAIDTLYDLQTWFLKDYWRQHLSFNGLMVARIEGAQSIEKLIHAGVDIFVVEATQVAQSHQYLKQFLAEGLMSEKVLNQKVRNILLAKSWTQEVTLPKEESFKEDNFKANHFPLEIRQLYEASLTVLNNASGTIPFVKVKKRKFECLQFSQKEFKTFKYYFGKYADYRSSLYRKSTTWSPKTKKARKTNRTLIVTLDQIESASQEHEGLVEKINQQAAFRPVVVVNFGNPLQLPLLDTSVVLVQLYERNKITESLAAQVLFGGVAARGRLPLSLSERLPFGAGSETQQTRLKYTIPEEVGIAAYKLVGIDAIVRNAIFAGAIPGCQVLVIKNNKAIYHKVFGAHSYDRKQAVAEDDLYDVASLTKVAATTLAAMKLYEQKEFKMKDRLKKHLDCGPKSKLRNISLRKIFTHQSRLQANMPIAPFILYKDSTDAVCNKYFCNEKKGAYQIKVAENFYLQEQWLDTMWAEIFDLKLRRSKRFRYSDVNFNLIQRMLEQKTKMGLERYLARNFYDDLGLRHCLYNPLEKISARRIVPTTQDTVWRHQLLRGYVHDESAALLGGIGGNAGLFANANDLGVIFQMLLNGGTYGGEKYLEPATIDYFVSAKHGNHRGLGFNRKQKKGTSGCSKKASNETFGHTGFTGTCIWADPKHDLIFVFLSNRIHPSVRNKLLYKNKIRERVQSVVYTALNTYPAK
ncbi:MAG: serine hydrolase [Saprospiraceae bacterium]